MRIFSVLILGVILAIGCQSQPATQFTIGVMSQIQVPKDLRSVRITASVNGNIKFCQTYPVDDGKTTLPQSLALAPEGDMSHSVLVSVIGFAKTKDDVMSAVPDDCSDRGNDAAPAQILRRSRQQYVPAKNLYVPMPLRYSCYGVECQAGETCRGGKCVSPDIDSSTLPEFAPDLLYGQTNTCFDVDACLGDAVGPTVIDADQCIYEVPPGSNFREIGMNVRAVYEGHGVEVLDLDREEGFFIPDPSKPNRFQLAPGVCHPASGGRRVVNVNASRSCASKNVFQPLCASSGKPLAPATSALYILMDRDMAMSDYVGPSAQPSQALDQVLGIVLADPVFSTTTKVAFKLVPDVNTCSATYETPDQLPDLVPPTNQFLPVWKAANPIVKLVHTTTPMSFPQLGADRIVSTGAGAFGGMNAPQAQNKYVLLLVTNRDPTDMGLSCGGDLANAIATNASGIVFGPEKKTIDTWILSLRRSDETAAQTQTRKANVMSIPGAKVISAEGPSASDAQLATISGLGDLVGDLAGCLYEAPGMVDPAHTEIYFKPPAPLPAVNVPFNASCSASSNADGWNVADNLVRICGASCSSLRSAIVTAGQATALKNAMAPSDGQQVLVFLRAK
jgi:hypothetical protein